MQSGLYVVGTPIGNLSDMSPRAVDVLRGCDLVAAEDTRVFAKLAAHFDIKTKCVSCHAILTGHPFTNIRCEYCDTIQTINEDSIII